MNREELDNIGAAFRNIGSTFAERFRQEGQGASPPFQFFYDNLGREATRLAVNGAQDVAAAVITLRSAIEESDNA